MWTLWLVLALAGFAADPDAEQEAARDEARLARELAELAPGEPQACVSPMPGQSVYPVSDRTFVFRRGGTIWVNRLEHRCDGLRPPTTVIAEMWGSQVCRGDRVRALEHGRSIPGPICFLGDWVPYRRR